MKALTLNSSVSIKDDNSEVYDDLISDLGDVVGIKDNLVRPLRLNPGYTNTQENNFFMIKSNVTLNLTNLDKKYLIGLGTYYYEEHRRISMVTLIVLDGKLIGIIKDRSNINAVSSSARELLRNHLFVGKVIAPTISEIGNRKVDSRDFYCFDSEPHKHMLIETLMSCFGEDTFFKIFDLYETRGYGLRGLGVSKPYEYDPKTFEKQKEDKSENKSKDKSVFGNKLNVVISEEGKKDNLPRKNSVKSFFNHFRKQQAFMDYVNGLDLSNLEWIDVSIGLTMDMYFKE